MVGFKDGICVMIGNHKYGMLIPFEGIQSISERMENNVCKVIPMMMMVNDDGRLESFL